MMRSLLSMAVLVTTAAPAAAVNQATAEAVIQRCVSIYKESGHPCACAFNQAKDGSHCGRRSAHDRPGGAEPVCLASEITPELERDFRTNEQVELRGRCAYRGR